MGAPGYYLEADSPETLIRLPRPPRWESAPIAIEETDILHETNGGVKWIYKRFKRRMPIYRFRVPESELAAFQAFHETVGGQETPFYYVVNPDASPLIVLYVRKEKDFKPANLGPYRFNRALVLWYDYELSLSEEIPPVNILA